MICALKTCNKTFEHKKGSNRKYCSDNCQHEAQKICWKKITDEKRRIKKGTLWVICLGIICQGRKKFKSMSKFNRICKVCAYHNKSQVDSYKVVSMGRAVRG